MSKKITYNGNTKQEIYDAYQKLLVQVKEQQGAKLDPVAEVAAKKAGETLAKAEQTASLSVEDQITSLQKNITATLASLSTGFAEEIAAFKNVQEAIELKQKELKELFDIEAELFTLAALVNTNQEIKGQFEAKMAQEREVAEAALAEINKQIAEAKETYAAEVKAEKAKIAQDRARDKEEYDYNFKRTKQQKHDELADELAAKEKEFNAGLQQMTDQINARLKEAEAREAAVAVREEKMAELEEKVAAFPQREAQIREEVTASVKKAEQTSNAIAQNYIKKDYEGQKAILENKIELLEGAVKAEQVKSAELASKLDEAYRKIQEMALASVDSSKAQSAFETMARSISLDKNQK